MPTQTFHDGADAFQVTRLDANSPVGAVLFAVGGGGNPERHMPLLEALAAQGCSVIAPHFERLTSPRPTEEHLLLRARRLRIALDQVARGELSVAGVGHSIGAAMLLALSGGQVWMRREGPLPIAPDPRLEKLALLAPATLFFQAPGGLDGVHADLAIWAGTRDEITPVAQADWLQRALAPRMSAQLRVCEGAGHFSFMHVPPPQSTEPLADREAFLAQLTAEVCSFVTAPRARATPSNGG